MNPFTEYAATLAQSIAGLIAYHMRSATPRQRGTDAPLNLSPLDDLRYAHLRAVHSVVEDYGNAYIIELRKVTDAEGLNELFRAIAREAISETEDALRNPHRADMLAKCEALRALAECIAGRDYRRDAMTEARRHAQQRLRSYAAQLGEMPDFVAECVDAYASAGGDRVALLAEYGQVFTAEKERRTKEAKRKAARNRRQNQKGD